MPSAEGPWRSGRHHGVGPRQRADSASWHYCTPLAEPPAAADRRRRCAWATKLVDHQTRRMLFMASGHVSCNEFDAMAKEMLRYLRAWKANELQGRTGTGTPAFLVKLRRR